MNSVYTLDIETASLREDMSAHAALEPWRLRQGLAEISSVAVCRPDESVIQIINDGTKESWRAKLKDLLQDLEGKKVFAHNAVFDVAWCIANLQPDRAGPIPSVVSNIKWMDTMLLAKWVVNGQIAESSHFSLSLKNLCKTFLPASQELVDFIDLKSEDHAAGDDSEYWEYRGRLDVIMTLRLAKFFRSKTPDYMKIGYKVECDCIVPVANSWVMGIRVDQEKLSILGPKYEHERQTIADELSVSTSLFSSPKQLGRFLFDDNGFPVREYTKSGNPSTSKDNLLWTRYDLLNARDNDRIIILDKILKAKSLATLISKYVKTAFAALSHTGDGYIYGAPRIFGTYTGRFTYSNSTMKKFKTGIALHQMPRKAKEIRECLLPPEGMSVYEADASGQESRLMAIRSGDETMIRIFNEQMNFHSMTGSSIIGTEYEGFEKSRAMEHGDGYYTEQRQLGKLTNLSCNYRIGGKALSNKAFVDYDTFMTVDTGMFLVKTFQRTYPGVPAYWKDVIAESKSIGYTTAFGGRRYKLSEWSDHRWITESSAINFPIQGAGASMKEIAIIELRKHCPEAMFSLDLHDASFMFVKTENMLAMAKRMDEVLDNIDYSKYWGFKTPIRLEYESVYGSNFSDVK